MSGSSTPGLAERLTALFVLGLACVGAVYITGLTADAWHRADKSGDTAVIRKVYVDTVRCYVPVARDSVVVRYVTAKLPLTTSMEAHDTTQASHGGSHPAPISPDSAAVDIPINSTVYSDSLYRAVVSGYMARLDSIEIYGRTVERTTVVTHRPKPCRWGLSVGVGAVATSSGSVAPGVFVGVSYTFKSL